MFRGQKQYLELQNLHFQKGLLQRSNQQDYFYRSKKKIKQLGHEVQMSPIVFNFLILILFFFYPLLCHSEEGSARARTKPRSRTDCPTRAAGAPDCTGLTTVVCAEMAAAAGHGAHAPPP